ncbi:MAG: ThuA domain-containing protein [Clostridia bacterium]|nr:ThuA domain-containing protein [Clostridia bacterium]
MADIRATVWNEFRHEKTDEAIKKIYPDGLHAEIGRALTAAGEIDVTLASLDDPEQGLPDEVLGNTDVLLWWGHMFHGQVDDELVAKIKRRVLEGMGLVVLHSGHHSKVFRSVVSGTGNLLWGNCIKEVVWNIAPTHPIAAGVPSHFVLDKEEVYAEPFGIPKPDELIFASWFENGCVFRSGCLWNRGHGKVFYFQPGHEEVPTFFNENVRKIIVNAVRYCSPKHTEGYKPTPDYECPYIGGSFIGGDEIEDFRF